MSKTAMIVLLVICSIVLVIAIIAIVPRLKNALAGVPLIVYILIVLGLIVLVAILALNIFGPKGTDSLTSKNVEGIEQGDADVDTALDEEDDGTGTHFTVQEALEGNEIGDNTIYITVRGDEVKIGSAPVEGEENLRAALISLSQENNPICLVDDYATSRAYTMALEVLDELNLNYTEHKNQ